MHVCVSHVCQMKRYVSLHVLIFLEIVVQLEKETQREKEEQTAKPKFK